MLLHEVAAPKYDLPKHRLEGVILSVEQRAYLIQTDDVVDSLEMHTENGANLPGVTTKRIPLVIEDGLVDGIPIKGLRPSFEFLPLGLGGFSSEHGECDQK